MSGAPEHAARLGVVALAATLVGCASSPDPYGGNRPATPSPRYFGERRPTGGPDHAAVPPPAGVVKASASVPAPGPAAPAPEDARPMPLTADSAVGYALEHNPALTAIRTQRGIAQAGVVIARQYPFNPLLQVFELGANGPSSSGITNHAFNETTMRLDLELRGQGRIRQAGAAATLTRTEWDIAAQEVTVAVGVLRAYHTALYRQKRLDVQDETIRLTEQVYEQTKKLADSAGSAPPTWSWPGRA